MKITEFCDKTGFHGLDPKQMKPYVELDISMGEWFDLFESLGIYKDEMED